jgi:hypothetical protein
MYIFPRGELNYLYNKMSRNVNCIGQIDMQVRMNFINARLSVLHRRVSEMIIKRKIQWRHASSPIL